MDSTYLWVGRVFSEVSEAGVDVVAGPVGIAEEGPACRRMNLLRPVQVVLARRFLTVCILELAVRLHERGAHRLQHC